LIQEAQTLHWTVLLTVTGAAPCWASACATTHIKHESMRQKLDAIVTNPNPTYYGQFLQAVGREFGSYVKLYSIWNEPNQPQMLLPQYVHNQVESAVIYRNLWLKGYAGLKASGNFSGMKVLFGETSPVGNKPYDIVAPLTFMRAALCLSSSYQRSAGCGRIPAAGYAQHPYDQKQGPYWVPPSYLDGADDVTMASLGSSRARSTRRPPPALYRLTCRSTSPSTGSRASPIYCSAYRSPSKRSTTRSPSRWLTRTRESRPLTSTAHGRPQPGRGSFQTGLETVTAHPKPLYHGYPVPLTVTVQNGSKVAFWVSCAPTVAATRR